MSIPAAMLDRLCPMHLAVDGGGRITRIGPTLAKVVRSPSPEGTPLFDLFEVTSPRGVHSLDDLVRFSLRRLRLKLRRPPHTPFAGHFVAADTGGGVVDLSFGIAVASALRDHPLTSADFPPTDLTVEMLFLIESKSAAMDSALQLNQRLQSARLMAEEQAHTDTLTGLRNRRAVEVELAGLAARQDPFAVMQIDLDHFKAVNDTFGHGAGDRVLEAVADAMVAGTRRGDLAARIGGDEFLVIVPTPPNPETLRRTAERLIARIKVPVRYRGQLLQISASVGIACHRGGPIGAPGRLIEAADAALYAAKSAGRSRVVFADCDDAA
ncbi:diguanylate cyclase domain-containing protein [Roseivivax sediminis]|uniref:Diguanylate cyclase (GGDEF) domain-containing protein n=1 Tax=Roseivivax sediminis TaxID=936889 RepID=A0A1I1TB41_9RHOB|nr:diguanylate cyclase [Roseivivax sediminis]SFD55852.1 diguanylate cyclase (GGDEF) domain-containing protein [Roseivivax sediminis]